MKHSGILVASGQAYLAGEADGAAIEFDSGARATFGGWTYGPVPEILSWGERGSVEVGRFCSIADGVRIFLGGNHDLRAVSTFPFDNPVGETKGPVTIGHDVWLGSRSTILSGVWIGDGAVVAAGAMVTKSVMRYEIVAGNPARVVGRRFEPREIAALIDSRWFLRSKDEIAAILRVSPEARYDPRRFAAEVAKLWAAETQKKRRRKP